MNTEEQQLNQLIQQVADASTAAKRSKARIQALRYHYLLPISLHNELADLVQPLMSESRLHDPVADPLLARAEFLLKPLEDRITA